MQDKRKLNDDQDGPQNSDFLVYNRMQKVITKLSVHIDEDFKEAAYYRKLVEDMQNLEPEDEVHFRLNTPGGYVVGLVSLLEAIRTTDARVVAYIAGACHSCGSILALTCPEVQVGPYATMLVHNVSYGTSGKNADVVAHAQHMDEFSQRLIRSTYEGFLTPSEIEEVINGKEYWLHADQIQDRLHARNEYFTKKIKAAQKKQKKTPEISG